VDGVAEPEFLVSPERTPSPLSLPSLGISKWLAYFGPWSTKRRNGERACESQQGKISLFSTCFVLPLIRLQRE
jgi:hypothetical protein